MAMPAVATNGPLPARRGYARTAGQDADLHTLAPQEIPHIANVLLDASESGEVALRYHANAKRAHSSSLL